MFIDNKYTKIYYKIIKNRKLNLLEDYTEEHHIIPKSLGGNNHKENLVNLSAREHFICHWLLTKMVDGVEEKYKMNNAFSCMLYRENDKQQRYKISSRKFENIKKNISSSRSEKFSGENNPMYKKTHNEETRKLLSDLNLGKIVSEETRKKLSDAHKGKLKSESHKQSLKKSWEKNKENRSGKNSSWYERNHSDYSKEKIRQKILSIPKQKCIHCGKETSPGNIKRWHNDACKFR